MTLLRELFELKETKWSGDVDAHWSPPVGFFTKPTADIVSGLKSASKDYAQASRRLNFFINRAGKKLSADDKSRLEAAKVALRRAFNKT